MGRYRIAGFFEGENFHEFHKSIAIHENFTLKIFLLQQGLNHHTYIAEISSTTSSSYNDIAGCCAIVTDLKLQSFKH